MAEWRFPASDYGDTKGINDSGVAIFRGTPLISLAREICQNSLDAAKKELVKVEFNAFKIKKEEIPGNEVLTDVFKRCRKYWQNQKAKTTQDFFDNASKKIEADEVSVLRISDFNTTGLLGSDKERDTDWSNLTKSSGVSDKNATAGGSFGIGKFATFACSDFSTVFYSTLDKDGLEAYQGVSRLVTFESDNNGPTTGVGYFGNERNTPVVSQKSFDKTFSRTKEDFGADIFIMGYRFHDEKWEDKIVVSILDGFLGAIWNEKLVVKVGNIEISKKTLDSLIQTYTDELTGYTEDYYNVLKSPKTHWVEVDVLKMGKVKLGLLFPEHDACKRVAMIRKTGMKILDKDRLAGYINFSGVMFIQGDDLNKELRLIENPEHTAWQPNRSPNPARSQAIVKALTDFIKDKIEEYASKSEGAELDPFGLGSLLPDEIEEEKSKIEKEETISDEIVAIEKKIVERKKKEKKDNKKNSEEVEPVLGEEGLDWLHDKEPKPKPSPEPMPPAPSDFVPSEDKKTQIIKKLELSKFVFMETNRSQGEYRIVFQCDETSQNTAVEITLSGETQSFDVPILSAKDIKGNSYKIEGNKIVGINVQGGIAMRLQIKIDYQDYCAMEVAAYAVKE